MFMAYLCYYLNFGCTLLVRHWTLQEKAKTLVQDIIATIKMFSLDDLTYKNDTDYIIIYIKNKPIFFITDLNRASDLKQASHLLKEFPIILYDEFLTLSSDYVANEYEKLKIIYQSIDRKANRAYIDHPKIILLGNPVNFDSPILPALKIYNAMQNQEINTINNTFTNDSKLKHKEGGIFDIVVSTGEQKKKKSKPRKEENDLLPQSELKPKKIYLLKRQTTFLRRLA